MLPLTIWILSVKERVALITNCLKNWGVYYVEIVKLVFSEKGQFAFLPLFFSLSPGLSFAFSYTSQWDKMFMIFH